VRFSRTGRSLPALAVLALLVVACASPSTNPSPSVASSPNLTAILGSPSIDPDQISARFDIGDGRELYLRCNGTGSPTILLEAGDESDVSEWSLVMPGLIGETRTCAYDRAGVGQSDPATGCRGLDDLLGDLEALLEVANIDGPYVLVGTSGGGFLMAGFAARHPDDVAGLVLVETPKALSAELYPEIVPLIACDAPSNVERRDYLGVEHAVWDNRAEIGDFPLAVISYDYEDPPGPDEETNVEDQRGWFVLSPRHGQTVVTSGHDVPGNEPQLVINEILAVLFAARAQ
jgi:pimeloyl-ACP methyl ester carboxylesterase